MVVGVPKEIKDHETRVGCVPSMVTALREHGHEVLVERGAGTGSSFRMKSTPRRVLLSSTSRPRCGTGQSSSSR